MGCLVNQYTAPLHASPYVSASKPCLKTIPSTTLLESGSVRAQNGRPDHQIVIILLFQRNPPDRGDSSTVKAANAMPRGGLLQAEVGAHRHPTLT